MLLDPERRAAYDAELRRRPSAEPEPDAGAETTTEQARPLPRRSPSSRAGCWPASPLLTLAVVAVTAVVWMQEPSAGSVESDARAAQAAAERAIVPILSYDATNLDASKAAAQPYLTGDYRKEYDKLFDGDHRRRTPRPPAPSSRPTWSAPAIVRSGDGPGPGLRRWSTRPAPTRQFTEPEVYKNWVTITMEKVDGDWLVASLDT